MSSNQGLTSLSSVLRLTAVVNMIKQKGLSPLKEMSEFIHISKGLDKVMDKMQEEGFVVIEGFLTPEEADELRTAGEELEKNRPKDEAKTFDAAKGNKPSQDTYFLESNDKIRYFLEKEKDAEGNCKLNKIGHALHWLHPMFRFYTFSNRVKSTCRALGMKDPTVVQSMYIYKSAGSGGEVKPHQDATYLSTDPETAVGFWIPLEDTTLENGCLCVEKGSHKSGVHIRMIRNPDKTAESFIIYDRPAPTYQSSTFSPLILSKGDCVLIHGQVVHQSASNNSVYNRPAYTFHVIEKGAKYSEGNWLQEGSGAPFVSLYETEQTAI